MANVGQTSFWHFCHDRNCNNQPQQHKRRNHKVVIICSPETKTIFFLQNCAMQDSLQHPKFFELCCTWTELRRVFSCSYMYIHYSLWGKFLLLQNNKNSALIHLFTQGLRSCTPRERFRFSKLYLFYLKLWLGPFISPSTNVHLKLDFNDSFKPIHHQTALKNSQGNLRKTLNPFLIRMS